MQYPRLQRFERAQSVLPINLTDRDRDIIRLVYRHRFLRSTHILELVSGSSQQLLRRLQALYHHGYLERPRCQLDYYYRTGSQPMVYGLGNKGVAVLRQDGIIKSESIHWAEKNRSVGTRYLDHALLVSDILVRIEAACRNSGRARLLLENEIVPSAGNSLRSVQWRVDIDADLNLGVIPDRLFALEFQNAQGTASRTCFILEADRGTMPVMRSGLTQTSIFRKLLSYSATWQQSVLREKFGIDRFRVAIVTTITARVAPIVEACSHLKRGHGLFLFTDVERFRKSDPLSLPWRTGRAGETGTLLD